jgi:hypothetical protein
MRYDGPSSYSQPSSDFSYQHFGREMLAQWKCEGSRGGYFFNWPHHQLIRGSKAVIFFNTVVKLFKVNSQSNEPAKS